jgi:hypothetical protein
MSENIDIEYRVSQWQRKPNGIKAEAWSSYEEFALAGSKDDPRQQC